jgi:hypothetical protein
MGTEGSSLGVKRPGREADHSPPSSAEVKNGGTVLHSPIRLHGIVLNSVSIGTILPVPFTMLLLSPPLILLSDSEIVSGSAHSPVSY